jgi:hypothetical protein
MANAKVRCFHQLIGPTERTSWSPHWSTFAAANSRSTPSYGNKEPSTYRNNRSESGMGRLLRLGHPSVSATASITWPIVAPELIQSGYAFLELHTQKQNTHRKLTKRQRWAPRVHVGSRTRMRAEPQGRNALIPELALYQAPFPSTASNSACATAASLSRKAARELLNTSRREYVRYIVQVSLQRGLGVPRHWPRQPWGKHV